MEKIKQIKTNSKDDKFYKNMSKNYKNIENIDD